MFVCARREQRMARRYNFECSADALGIVLVRSRKPGELTTLSGSTKKSDAWMVHLVNGKKGVPLRWQKDGHKEEDITNPVPLDAAELIAKGMCLLEGHEEMEGTHDEMGALNKKPFNIFRGRYYDRVVENEDDEDEEQQTHVLIEKHKVGWPYFRPQKQYPTQEITWTDVKQTCAAVDFTLMQIALLYERRVREAGGLVPGEVPAISTLRWLLTADVEQKLLPDKTYIRGEMVRWHKEVLILHHFFKWLTYKENLGEATDDFYTRDAARVAWLLKNPSRRVGEREWKKFDGLRDWRRDDYPRHLHPEGVFQGEHLRLPVDPPPLREWGTAPKGQNDSDKWDKTLTLEKPAPEGEDQSVQRLAVLLRRLNTDKALNDQFFTDLYQGDYNWAKVTNDEGEEEIEDMGKGLDPEKIEALAKFFGVLNLCRPPAARPMDVDPASDISADEGMEEE